jgi:hypothetical protein
MFVCIISVDLNDDYILRFNMSFDNKKKCDDTMKIINDKKYESDFSKNCVNAHLSTESTEFKNSTFFNCSKDAITFLESFFKEFRTINNQLKKKYKVYETNYSNIFKEKMDNFYDYHNSSSDNEYF